MQNMTQTQKILRDLFLLVMLTLGGTSGYMFIEKWNFLDSLFMTITTICTVGYGEVHQLSDAGRIYTMVLILSGVGFALYVLTDMVKPLLELNLGTRKMKNQIVKLSNHQIVCGFGRTGQEVAAHFKGQNIPFVIIEADESRAKQAMEAGYLVIVGDASTDEMLTEAQISKADGIVCALPDDTTNTFIALSAKGLKENIAIVSRAANPGSEAKLKRAGARMVISPYVICGKRMATAVTHPLVTEFLDVVMHSPGYDLRMEQIVVSETSRIVGKTLKDANIKQLAGAMILAVNQGGKLITNPSPDLLFAKGDELIALGTEQELVKLQEIAGARNA